MTGRVRVLLWHRAPEDSADPVVSAYHEISAALRDTPGLVGNELLRAPTDGRCLVVASEWESLTAFDTWVRKPAHQRTTALLRPYRDHARPRPFEVLEVIAAY